MQRYEYDLIIDTSPSIWAMSHGSCNKVSFITCIQAEAIAAIRKQIEIDSGENAARYELSSKYVESFGNLAKETNTLILPADAGDIPKMVTTALATFESVKK